MKNLFRTLALLSIVIVLSACSPMLNRVVELPDQLAQGILVLSALIVGWVFAQVGAALPWFVKLFGQYQDEIAFAIAGAVIGAIQSALDTIPFAWEAVGNLALALLVAVLAALGVFKILGKAKVKTFRA